MADTSRPVGRFHDLDVGPDDWGTMMPFDASILDWRRGPDGTAYFLFAAPESVTWLPSADFDWSRVDPRRVQEEAGQRRLVATPIVVCRRLVGQEIGPNSTALAVNIAVVTDDRLAGLDGIDFAMVQMVAVAHLTMLAPPA